MSRTDRMLRNDRDMEYSDSERAARARREALEKQGSECRDTRPPKT